MVLFAAEDLQLNSGTALALIPTSLRLSNSKAVVFEE